ncbi:MAG: hypothetical protein JST75_08075 [Bacteroidetes bacterium]|nr:hypothetical protein [Bacteroidota bacterium]
MKFIVLLISTLNAYLGLRFFLNVIDILQTTKYSKTATAVFAILFLGMGIAGFYFSLSKNEQKIGLLIGIGPWVLALIFLLINMLTSDYK